MPFDAVRNPSALRRGEGVYLLGYPLRKAWRINTTPEKFAEPSGAFLEFESNFLARGHSGGALLDERHELVGMRKSEDPPFGEAVSITRVMDKLREWGYSVNLARQPMPTGFSSVSAGRAHTCRITTTGAAYCWAEKRTMPESISGGLTFRSLRVGGNHACGVTTAGAVYCWGGLRNDYDVKKSEIYSRVPVPIRMSTE